MRDDVDVHSEMMDMVDDENKNSLTFPDPSPDCILALSIKQPQYPSNWPPSTPASRPAPLSP